MSYELSGLGALGSGGPGFRGGYERPMGPMHVLTPYRRVVGVPRTTPGRYLAWSGGNLVGPPPADPRNPAGNLAGLGELGRMGSYELAGLGAVEIDPTALLPRSDGPPPPLPPAARCAAGGVVGSLAGGVFVSWWLGPLLGVVAYALGAKHPLAWAVGGLVAPPLLGGAAGCAAGVRNPEGVRVT